MGELLCLLFELKSFVDSFGGNTHRFFVTVPYTKSLQETYGFGLNSKFFLPSRVLAWLSVNSRFSKIFLLLELEFHISMCPLGSASTSQVILIVA